MADFRVKKHAYFMCFMLWSRIAYADPALDKTTYNDLYQQLLENKEVGQIEVSPNNKDLLITYIVKKDFPTEQK